MGATVAVTEPPSVRQPAGRLSSSRDGEVFPDHEWVPRLTSSGAIRDDAISRLRQLMLRASRHQVSRMPQAIDLGATRRDEIIHSAADEATLAVLSRLPSFEGRSRFTTWAYKFGIFQAGAEVRRAAWDGREIQLHDLPVVDPNPAGSPEAQAESRDLAAAVRDAMRQELTPHQRRVAIALLVEGIPIDVLANRLGTTRNALYKTLHDTRRRLRAHLRAQGRLGPTPEVTP
jgi:RNA polymerase sigma-70 factor (ECF subfamily)